MRFLHTADWHVGKPLRGQSRLDEYARALDEVLGIAIDRRVDVVLVGGDVFDSPAPPPEAERLVYDFLARLLPHRIACVLIAGNHDHPRRLAALSALLESLRLHVRAEVRPASQGGVVRVPSRDGREEADVVVLPFVPERRVVDACQLMGPEDQWYSAYAERVMQILQVLARDLSPVRPSVLLAHLLIDGARVGTGERALHLGKAYGLSAQQLPAAFQLVALGHLHRPQEIAAPSRAFYPGSLLELDFGESEQDKRVLVADLRPGRPAEVEWVPLTSGRRLREIEGPLEAVLADGRRFPEDWLRVRVRTEGHVPGVAEQVKEALPRAIDVALAYERKVWEQPAGGARALAPPELFTAFYRKRNQNEPGPELLKLFQEVYEEAHR